MKSSDKSNGESSGIMMHTQCAKMGSDTDRDDEETRWTDRYGNYGGD